MPNSTLFPLVDQPQPTAADRVEPAVWLKRLIVLPSLRSEKVIRDIPFRRGLNVIQTRKMKARGERPAGHSVGKTLLVRLIRFSLGEKHFGTSDTEQKVLGVFPTGVVVTHWRIDGEDWIVVRPLNDPDGKLAFASKDSRWQAVVGRHCEELPHRKFAAALNKVVTEPLPKFTLPGGRAAKWADVIGWLSRDYQCGYRLANEWRHADAQQESIHHRETNSLLMQWLMGLMSSEEIDLRIKHRNLLKEKAAQKSGTERQQKRLETLWPPLRDKMELPTDAEIQTQQLTFDSIRPLDHVRDKKASLKRLKDEEKQNSRVIALSDAHDQAVEKHAECVADIKACKALIQYIQKQIEEFEADPYKAYAKCRATPSCWMRNQAEIAADIPAVDDHLGDLKQQLGEQKNVLSRHEESKAKLAKAQADAKKDVEEERSRLAKVLSGIDESVGRWQGFEPDAETFQDLANNLSYSQQNLKRAVKDIDESKQVQESLRDRNRPAIEILSNEYRRLLRMIFGESVEASIKIDGNGLYPVPGPDLAPSGAALSVMTSVLAFDLASVSASLRGVGQHPRFVVHDSPREGDMEPPLFARLFEVAHELEEEFTDPDSVSFQYIVTTTTSPPEHLSQDPYVILTLDGRKEKGLLLKKRFS